ncbi:hypothetical protein FKP32DRAFT_880909 [Trametes sanguinea]|nr:hypothetical protein FKP32DRAFT_880909 [Trametes sanguinea]
MLMGPYVPATERRSRMEIINFVGVWRDRPKQGRPEAGNGGRVSSSTAPRSGVFLVCASSPFLYERGDMRFEAPRVGLRPQRPSPPPVSPPPASPPPSGSFSTLLSLPCHSNWDTQGPPSSSFSCFHSRTIPHRHMQHVPTTCPSRHHMPRHIQISLDASLTTRTRIHMDLHRASRLLSHLHITPDRHLQHP